MFNAKFCIYKNKFITIKFVFIKLFMDSLNSENVF